MSVLGRFPRWLRRALLGVNLAASLALLVANWISTYPNLIASWVVGAAVAAVALPAGAWLGRWLDKRHSGHHADTRAHIEQQFAAHDAVQGERMQVISDQLAALHARLDQQQGGAP